MIASLHEGTFSVGTDRKFVPVPRGDPPHKGAFKLAINPFLIHDGSLTALIDAGLGPFGPLDHYSLMIRNLKKYNLDPADIQHVFISHLHIDHIGGLLYNQSGTFEPAFPNASVWLSGADWERFTANAENKGHEVTLQWAKFLETHADMRYIEEEPLPSNNIRMKTIGGHTKYHQGIFYENRDRKAMMLGDVLARPEVINRKFVAKFDYDGKKSRDVRNEYLRVALKENYYILTYHSTNAAISKLKGYDQQKGYEIEHVTSEVIGSRP